LAHAFAESRPQNVARFVFLSKFAVRVWLTSFLGFSTDDGRVWFWGTVQESTWMFRIVMNTLQTTWVPVSPSYGEWALHNFVDVAIGYHAVALVTTDYKLYTVGWNNYYNFTSLLGRTFSPTDTPVFQWPFGVTMNTPLDTWMFKKVFGGTWNFFALSTSGLVGWGLNTNGQLARDPTVTAYAGPPVEIVLPQAVSTLALSSSHVLAVTGDGFVYAWGLGRDGQLGVDPSSIGPLGYRYTPAKISSLSGVVSVMADDGRSAVITSAGALYIFGDYPSYLFSGSSWVPAPLQIESSDYKIRGGCMRKSSITSAMRFMMIGENRTSIQLFAAGDNYDGELLLITQQTRVGTLTKASALTEVDGDPIVDVACSDESTTVLGGSGNAYTWTDRSTTIANRELSLRTVPGLIDGMSDGPTPTIVDSRAAMSQGGSVLNYAGIKKVSAKNVIAMITDETNAATPLVFWGQNPPYGIFGANSIIRRVGFTEAPSSQNWIGVSVGYDRAFYLHESGELWWTGEFSSASAQDGIVRIGKYGSVLLSFKWIVALYQSEIAVTADGDIWTLRQLKNSSSGEWNYDTQPRLLSGASEWKVGWTSPVKDVQGNWYCEINCTQLTWNVYLLLEDGNMFALGSNTYGQFCQNLPGAPYSEVPTLLPPVPANDNGMPQTITSFAAGGGFFVALFNDTQTGTNAYGCGANQYNQFVRFLDSVSFLKRSHSQLLLRDKPLPLSSKFLILV
jgi:alpha-tubulin suppressor-like RCC1 family protein